MHVMMLSFLLTSACTSILLSPDAAIKQQIGRSKLMLYNKIYTGTPCAWGDDLRNHHLKRWIIASDQGRHARVPRITHVFHVSGYRYLRSIGAGKFVRSGTLPAGGYLWSLRFYPAATAAPTAWTCMEFIFCPKRLEDVESQGHAELKTTCPSVLVEILERSSILPNVAYCSW